MDDEVRIGGELKEEVGDGTAVIARRIGVAVWSIDIENQHGERLPLTGEVDGFKAGRAFQHALASRRMEIQFL